MTTVRTVTGWLTDAYPPGLAEEWDRVGLGCGDPDAPVVGVLLAVDVSDEVIAEARAVGAQLLVTHHPLLLRGVHAVRRDQPKGRLVLALAEAGLSQFAAHTNADAADPGVSDALADALRLTDRRPLEPAAGPARDKLITFVPPDHADAVVDALAAAGAGTVGAYDRCSFATPGVGSFLPRDGADPYVGAVGEVERTPELRVEMVVPRGRRAAVVRALLDAHPYDEPAFDLVELVSPPSGEGLGRIGRLPEPMAARDVARTLAAALPPTATGARLGGDPERLVETVAVLGGAGDSLLDAARAAGVDLYVTSDLRHHPAQDALAHDDAPALIDIPHWAAEWLWLPHAEKVLQDAAAAAGVRLETHVSRLNTDPWAERY